MTDETIDSFANLFAGPPGAAQREAREARARKERRTQLTPKQLKRGAVRTSQINFRCSPEFKEKAAAVQRHMGDGWSIADVMEAALDLFAAKQGVKG